MFKQFFDNSDMFSRIFLAPDTGADGSGDDTSNDDSAHGGDTGKTFTEQQLEQILARRLEKQRKSMEKQSQTQSDMIKQLQEQLEEMKAKIAANAEPTGDTKAPAAAEALLQQQRLERKIEELENRVREADAARLRAEQDRRNSLKDQTVSKAILALNVPDATAAERYLAPMVHFNEDRGEWVLEYKGDDIDITPENVKDVLPPVLREAPRAGGSGSFTGSPKKEKLSRELETAKQVLDKLTERARRTANQEDILQFQKQQRKVRELTAELANTK